MIIKISMNIDIESIGLLSLILQDSPKDHQLILCVLARSNSVPERLTFHPNTDYPTFYGYSNSRIPFYLMGKGVLSNVPRQGYVKRLISAHYLSFAEVLINKNKNWDIHQKLMGISKVITLDNRTIYKDAEIFLLYRDKAITYIKDYAVSHVDEIRSFLGQELADKFLGRQEQADEGTFFQFIKNKVEGQGIEKKEETAQKVYQESDNTYKKFATGVQDRKKCNPLICNKLKVDLSRATLQYDQNKSVDISPQNREIIFLSMLFEADGDVVYHKDVVTRLKLKAVKDENTNEDFARDVQFLRRDLGKMLKKAGMNENEIEKMIRVVRKTGYQLRCQK